MVKKGSFFARIAGRLRAGSGVRVDESDRSVELAGEPSKAHVDRVGEAMPVGGVLGEPRTARKLSEREEAMVALGGHFQELASLLRGVHARMDGQLGRLVETASSLQELPLLSGQQLEVMRGLAGHMERQNELGEKVAKTLQGLPVLLQNVESALQRAAATDERTATTMREFQSTMDRIHSAMGRMVEHSELQSKATRNLAEQRSEAMQSLAEGMQQVQRDSVRELRDATDVSLQSLRRTHEDQSNRLQRVVQDHAGWNKAVLFALGMVMLGVIGLLVMQVVR